VTELDPADLRISDTEREDAMRKLGEHMSVGRLDLEEYGERTAKVTAARTRRQLTELFVDLPEPRPTFGPPAKAVAANPAAQPSGPPRNRSPEWRDQPLAQRVWGAMVPISALIAVVLFLTVFKVWLIFLLPAAVAIIGGSLWGDDWRNRRGFEHRMHHRRHGHWRDDRP
jgi:hypothetical protein